MPKTAVALAAACACARPQAQTELDPSTAAMALRELPKTRLTSCADAYTAPGRQFGLVLQAQL